MCLIVVLVPSYISSMTDFESVRPGAVPGGTAILDAIVPNLQQLTIQLHFILFYLRRLVFRRLYYETWN